MLEIISKAYSNYYQYLIKEITSPGLENYFYALILFSLAVWGLEIIHPWRKHQKIIRKDFFLDLFYMFFNFFIFNLILFIALSDMVHFGFQSLLAYLNISEQNLQLFNISELPVAVGLLVFFLLSDFVQWGVHVTLHKVPFLWNFHKVHHSVKEMGFAAHLRYHWFETFAYKPIVYLLLVLIGGFEVSQVFLVHYFALLIGHLNHSNFEYDLGPLKYIFNNNKMHIWHHSKKLPKNHRFGMNFGISLSIWDYIFKTAYIPHDGRDIPLGFHKDEEMPKDFIGQELFPLTKKKLK